MPHAASETFAGQKSNPIRTYNLAAFKLALNRVRDRPAEAFTLLTENLEFCANADIAAQLVESATAIGRYDVAEQALRVAADPSGMLRAQLHMVQDNPHGALMAITSRPTDARQLARYFGLHMRANLLMNRYDAAVRTAQEWADHTPHSPTPFQVFAKLLKAQGDSRAMIWSGRAHDVAHGAPQMLRAV